MNVDWGRLRAVVIQSDDWGLCAWVPDEQAYRALTDSPVWREEAGRIYGRSTLESAEDVRRLTETLLAFRGGDGFPPVWQANTVMAAPDYAKLEPPLFPVQELPLIPLPQTPSRWQRPGLWEEVRRAAEAGLWWAELHGLHHLPAAAWLRALRRGAVDARRAHEHQCLVCEAVQASGEYDPSEPPEQRAWNLRRGIECFRALFGRAPTSLCPPDYRWDDSLETEAERLDLTIVQGKGEQLGPFPRVRRLLHRLRWQESQGKRFCMPVRIAFEPRGHAEAGGRLGPEAAHRGARGAWSHGQPAVVSTHRVSYAHLDARWSEAGRAALSSLLGRLTADGAIFLTDAEVRSLAFHGWSARPIGARGVLVRCYSGERETVRLPAPEGVTYVSVREGRGADVQVALEEGEVVAHLDRGEYLLEWKR